MLPGYVYSEVYGVTNDRVVSACSRPRGAHVSGLLDERSRDCAESAERKLQQMAVPNRHVINERGEMAGTLLVAGNRRAVRWTRDGKAAFLHGLPGHAWTNVWSINRNGIVSGCSCTLTSEDGENNTVLWDASGKVVALKTVSGLAEGAAEASNAAV